MTSIQLFARACEVLSGTPQNLSLDDTVMVIGAMNGALTEYLSLLPPERRVSPASARVRAPLTRQINIVNGAVGFAWVLGGGAFPAGGYSSEADVVGKAMAVSDDGSLNRLNRPGELLMPYLGPTNTAATATVYCDALPMGQTDLQVIGNPVLLSGGSKHELVFDHSLRWKTPAAAETETGTPRFWWTENLLNVERASAPQWHVRLWPLPTVDGVLLLDVAADSSMLGLEELTTPRSLAVLDADVQPVVSLVHERLLLHPRLREKINVQAINNAAARDRAALKNKAPRRTTVPNGVGTPRGF